MNYLEVSNEYYTNEKISESWYSTPYPNYEESCRFGAIIAFVSLARHYYQEKSIVPRILDVGAGRGWLTNLLSVFGVCHGIEPAAGPVEFARAHYRDIMFFNDTLDNLLQTSDFMPYEIVVTSEVIEHVPYQYQKEFVANINRALKPEGFCVFTTPRGELYKSWLLADNTPQPIENWLTERQILDLFTSYGFRPLNHTRAFPLKCTALSRFFLGRRFLRALSILRLGCLRNCVEYIFSIYGVWLFQKTKSVTD